MRRSHPVLITIFLLAAACGACREPLESPQRPREIKVPEYLENTIGERAIISGGDAVLVQGLGLVTGLAGTGSTAHPPGIRNRMLKIITQHEVPNPETVLADPNTAVVFISGYIPPGSRPGEPFDLVLTAAPGTQTTSLEGGTLLWSELYRVEMTRTGSAPGKALALGEGELFVSPFVVEDAGRPASEGAPQARGGLRLIDSAPAPEPAPETPGAEEPTRRTAPTAAWILGGGRCRYTRNFFLNLLEPSERTAQQIIRHINARFPGAARGNIDPGIIDLTVPADYAHDKLRFLEVVNAIYLIDSPDQRERRIRELVAKLRAGRDPTGIMAAMEAFGKPTIPLVEPLLRDPDAGVRFCAAEVLCRLDQPIAIQTLEAFVRDDASPHQERAVLALGELSGASAAGVIHRGFSAKSPRVRIASYLTLRRVAPTLLDAMDIPGRLELGVVKAGDDPFIFVSRQIKPRIVIFGDAAIDPPLLVTTPRLLVSAIQGDDRVAMASKEFGWQNVIRPRLALVDIIVTMAGWPRIDMDRPKLNALDLSYSDVVGFLDQASRQWALKAPIVYEPVAFVGPETDLTAPLEDATGDIVIPEK